MNDTALFEASALPVRFAAKINVAASGCWDWTGCKTRGGYGRFGFDYKTVLAHRFSFQRLVGPIPEGLHLDHLCRNRGCVNPAHLEPVTCRENVLRGEGLAAENAVKTECKRGHPLEGDNLAIRNGNRMCRRCQLDAHARWESANRAKVNAGKRARAAKAKGATA